MLTGTWDGFILGWFLLGAGFIGVVFVRGGVYWGVFVRGGVYWVLFIGVGIFEAGLLEKGLLGAEFIIVLSGLEAGLYVWRLDEGVKFLIMVTITSSMPEPAQKTGKGN